MNNLVVITNFLAFLYFYLKIFPSCGSGSRRENKCGSMWIRILKPVSKETRKEFFSFFFHGETNDWQSARRGIIYCFYQETLEVMSVWGEGKGYTTKETNSRSGLYCPDSLAVLWLPHHHIAAKTSGHCFHHHTMLKECSFNNQCFGSGFRGLLGPGSESGDKGKQKVKYSQTNFTFFNILSFN